MEVAMPIKDAVKICADVRLEIIELMALYAWAYDTEDAKALQATFTVDGELEVFGNILARSVDGFEAFIAMAAEMKSGHGWQHLADHHVFRDYDGQSCTVYSYYTMAQGNAAGDDVSLRAMGYYISQCALTNEGWRFARRRVVRWDGRSPFAHA